MTAASSAHWPPNIIVSCSLNNCLQSHMIVSACMQADSDCCADEFSIAGFPLKVWNTCKGSKRSCTYHSQHQ